MPPEVFIAYSSLIYQSDGVFFISFQGYSSFLLRDLPFDAIQFCIYEQLRIGYKVAVRSLNPANCRIYSFFFSAKNLHDFHFCIEWANAVKNWFTHGNRLLGGSLDHFLKICHNKSKLILLGFWSWMPSNWIFFPVLRPREIWPTQRTLWLAPLLVIPSWNCDTSGFKVDLFFVPINSHNINSTFKTGNFIYYY